MPEKKHPSDQTIIKYVSGELAENSEIRVGEHIGACKRCLEKSRNVFQYSVLLANWTAKLHGEIYWQARINEALESARTTAQNSLIKQRVETWIEIWKGKVGGVIQIVAPEAEAKKNVITDLPQSLLADNASWKFTEAAVIRGTKRGAGEIEIISQEKPAIHLLVNIKERKVMAQMEESGQQAPLIVIAPKNRKAISVEPKKVEGTKYFTASFENIPFKDTAIIVEAQDRLYYKKKRS